ncbi:hypothetical protein D770_24465 [Flammeovirgaceae bacterium 311]|nr:hypothetical protein D770_24465 [Flammeovirgaceae bacterium 311]
MKFFGTSPSTLYLSYAIRFVLVALLLTGILALTDQEPEPVWYTFNPAAEYHDTRLDMHNWLDAPAGKHGYVKLDGGDFSFENGKKVKFWGVNIASGWSFPNKPEADQWTHYLAHYGLNSVRFHKFTAPGMEKGVSTRLAADKFDRLDYFSAKLREQGIYYGWSHIYGHKPLPGDSSRLLAYEEVKEAGGGHLKGSTIGLVNFAPDLQDLSIELTINMLEHVNPYTGIRYADDPALNFVELQNEDNLFFATAHNWIMKAPTYKKLISLQFSEWLLDKYKTEEALVQAWGNSALNAWPNFQQQESLEERNIYPLAHHGYLSREYFEQNPQLQARLLDTAFFLYETQNKFYNRYIAAIRKTGYRGPIVASGWQAGDFVAHYLNLHSDYKAGIIDRHNYFGGGKGHRLDTGRFSNISMVSQPGSGLLSTGMQAVADRPFALSEWMSLIPTEWIAESSPIVAIYGMGLQGWDASYAYASNQPAITKTIEAPRHGLYNFDSPLYMPLSPTLARMIYRGDINEGSVVASRKVHLPDLAEGKLNFDEKILQNQDVKSFEGTPQEALARGKVVVEFTSSPEASQIPSLRDLYDQSGNSITSTTGELVWHKAPGEYFTVNTAGTKGMVGFAPEIPISLGDIQLQTYNPFTVVLLTSLEKDKNMAEAESWLVTTLARARNTGMEYDSDKQMLLAPGSAPVLLEAVDAELLFRGRKPKWAYVLDHTGRRTSQKIRLKKNKLSLLGSKYKTLYYEVVF